MPLMNMTCSPHTKWAQTIIDSDEHNIAIQEVLRSEHSSLSVSTAHGEASAVNPHHNGT